MTRPAGADLPVTLSNPRADRIKEVRALAGRSVRNRTGLFLVEGPQGAREAMRFAADRVRGLYVDPAAAERHPEILEAAEVGGVRIHGATPEVIEAISGDAQGIVAVVNSAVVASDLESALAGEPRLVAVLSNVRDPGNLGAIVRVADAAGVDAVVLAGDCVEPTNPKVVRATAGSLFHVPVVAGASLVDAVAAARAVGMRILAADGGGELVLGDPGADATALAAPTCWIFGNEAWGLGSEELALADAAVRIPIRGRAESLNLATAVALCLYAALR